MRIACETLVPGRVDVCNRKPLPLCNVCAKDCGLWTRLAVEFELGFKVCSRAGSETLNPKPGPGRNSI